MSDPIQTIAKQLGIQTFGDGLLVKIRETIDLLRDEAYDCKQYREVVTQQAREIAVLKANVVTDNSVVLVNALAELERLKVQPSGVVRWPEADEIMQMAFEEGQPSEDASGYYFELEEFDLFIQRLMEEVARLNQPASAGDERAALRYTSDGELAECPCCGSLDVGGANGTVSCYSCDLQMTKPRPLQNAADAWNKRAALSANHSEQVRECSLSRESLTLAYRLITKDLETLANGSAIDRFKSAQDEFRSAIAAAPSAGSQEKE